MKPIRYILAALALFGAVAQAHAADTPRAYTAGGSMASAGMAVITWQGLDGDDTGIPVSAALCKRPLSVQIGAQGGNTHGGGTYIMQVSNDPAADPAHPSHASAVWATLTDANGNNVSRTTAALWEQLLGSSGLWYRPRSTSGTSGDMDVVLVCGK